MDPEKRFEQLKRTLFDAGQDAIEAFLGYGISLDEDKDITNNRLDIAYDGMSPEELEEFYSQYNIGVLLSRKERCMDCPALVEIPHCEYFCDEFQVPCEEVDDCPEWENDPSMPDGDY